MGKKEGTICTVRCVKLLQDILLPATECKSASTQQTHIQYLELILTTLSIAIADVATDFNKGNDIPDINHGIRKVFIGKQVTKFKNAADVIVSKNGKDNRQYDFQVNDMVKLKESI